MANSLNLTLKKGQAVLLNSGKVVYCKGGFGMFSSTTGTGLIVADEKGKIVVVSGFDIDRLVEETQAKTE